MIHIIVSCVLALLFLVTGAGKVLGLGYANRQRDLLHVQPRFWRITGILEWAGAVGLVLGIWLPWLGVLAAGCLALFMIAAAFARIRASRRAGTTHGLAIGVITDLFLAVIAAVTAALIAMGR
jgi:uncharacterized membrane protein YphA (DoxX/SURF4 family)